MIKQDHPTFSAGLPIEAEEHDRLAHGPFARELADAIRNRSPTQGFVIGIEGAWGVGKSSIANLLDRALLTTAHKKSRERLIRFQPWLIGSRDQLLGQLFAELIRAASKLGPPPISNVCNVSTSLKAWWRLRKLTRDQRLWFDLFGALAERVGQLGSVGVALGVVDGGTTAALLAGVVGTQLGASRREPKSLEEIKADIGRALSGLGARLIVLIDDLDRLEPGEAVEVLRLVRAVADFENVTYVLCYDRDLLAQAIKAELKLKDGAEFLHKVVQLPIRVPRPESFQLRRWFDGELARMFSTQLLASRNDADRDRLDRLAAVIDRYGGRYLRTPRDVTLTLNALALHVPALGKDFDFADLVWIVLIRQGNRKLFAWVESYLTDAAAVANGAIVTDLERDQAIQNLEKILVGERLDADRELHDLAERLPGLRRSIAPGGGPESKWAAFDRVTRGELRQFIEKKRIGSPDHYRNYFAFWRPEGSISDADIAQFKRHLKESPAEAKATFVTATKTLLPGEVLQADRLLEQVMMSGDLDAVQATSLIECLGEGMDEAADLDAPSMLWGPQIWRRGEDAFRGLYRRVPRADQSVFAKRLFTTGKAIGFLTNLLRHETFDHGVYGDRAKPESEWLFDQATFDSIADSMRDRFRKATPQELLQTPELLSLLFGWRQVGGQDECKSKVAEVIADDDGLLAFLARCRGWASRSSRNKTVVFRSLKRRELQNFLDVRDAARRLDKIASDAGVDEHRRAQALELIQALKDGEDYDL